MDVELQILKHLKRSPKSTVWVIDEYCSAYPFSVTLRNFKVVEKRFSHQVNKKKIDS